MTAHARLKLIFYALIFCSTIFKDRENSFILISSRVFEFDKITICNALFVFII